MKTEFMLKNNIIIPKIGFGTWKLKNDESTIDIINSAILNGYKHIDTAFAYGNEEMIGKGIKKSQIKRKDIFITGKLWNSDRGYNNVINACKNTIKRLGVDYLDLYLIHWPASKALYENWKEINKETWKAFEYLYNEGLVKAIGVCNFKIHHLEELKQTAKIFPMVNQIEFHPGNFQKEILDYCTEHNILVEAWSPLGSGKLIRKNELIEIAKKYDISVAQLCIKWCLQHNVLPLPKSKEEDKMIENLDIDNFQINEEDMRNLDKIQNLGCSGLDSDTLTLFN